VVFDFDGVLADTERLHFDAFQDVFARRGWTLTSAEYYGRYLGHGDEALIHAFAGDRGLAIPASDAARMLEEKSVAFRRRMAAGNVLYPGAGSCIGRLAPIFALAIASGALRDEITDILDANDLRPAFQAIVAIEDVMRGKPDPEPFRLAASRLGVPPAQCLAVEDSRWGLAAAQAAGMRTLALPTTSPRDDLASADRIIESLEELTVDLVRTFGTAPGL
jgi:beta-phosphoglucomutase-like phosphatase (HAD superfamily)